jgi:hypothetical protein
LGVGRSSPSQEERGKKDIQGMTIRLDIVLPVVRKFEGDVTRRRSRCGRCGEEEEEEEDEGLTSNQFSLTSGGLTGNERFDANRDHILADLYQRRI